MPHNKIWIENWKQKKNLPANAGDIRDARSIPGSEDPLEEDMATHSSILD